MNEIKIDGTVQNDPKLYDEIAEFNISSITGEFTLPNNTKRHRFTFIRVIYPHTVTPTVRKLIVSGAMIRIEGKLDSEQYTTSRDKIVYNKIIVADKIKRIRWNHDTQQYDEIEDV